VSSYLLTGSFNLAATASLFDKSFFNKFEVIKEISFVSEYK